MKKKHRLSTYVCVFEVFEIIDLQTKHDTELKLASINFSQKSYKRLYKETPGCKPCVTNSLIIPHTLAILIANIAYCIILLEICS